jgi:RimJ/RimL family protein N-acetyltransferase
MNAPIEFETQRLFLRQWRASDRESFAALNADSVVMAHFPAPLTREKSDAMADYCQRLIAERTEFMELHRKYWPGFDGESEVRPMFDTGMGP